MRENPDLDAVFDGATAATLPLPREKKRRKEKTDRDVIRRRAFRVLALLADLDARHRLAVLKAAERLNRA